MKVKIFEFNPISENTYLLYDETKECVIIDAGCFYPDEKQQLLDFILDNELVVKHLLNTHLHFDHVLGNKFILDQFHLKPEANDKDSFLLDAMPAQMQMFGFREAETAPELGNIIKENDVITFGSQRLVVLEVPGHSPGSIAFYSEEGQCVFVGDALFRSSIGRTDLPGGDFEELINSIKTKLLTLPLETVVYSGHGPQTSIQFEAKNNPYLQ